MLEPTTAPGRYVRTFRTTARGGKPGILTEFGAAIGWYRAGVSLEDAVAWADRGFLPGEAASLIAQGVGPEMAGELEAIAVDVAGSAEEHAMREIDRLVATGAFVDPRRVRIEQDPYDPDVYDVHVLPEGETWER